MTTTSKKISVQKIRRVAEVLKAIGHPVRLQVLQALEAGQLLCVSEIQQAIRLKVEQSLLSHHLIKMKDKGILLSEKRGMNVYYSISDRQILKIFECMENCRI